VLGAAAVLGCNSGPTPQQVAQQQMQRAQQVASSPCPPTGNWAECSVTARLLSAGLGVRLDSVPARDSAMARPGLLYNIGRATLQVYLFADSAERKAATAGIDTARYASYTATQGYPPKPALLRSANLVALLVSQNDEQRQRIGDAIMAGAPQPPKK
jgi:hypothetical protein